MFELPKRITVRSVASSRYTTNSDCVESGLVRPLSWDDKRAGLDRIVSVEAGEILLQSDGMQSVPQAGWVLMLTGGDSSIGYNWTVYGMKSGAANS